jgi:hypothetical protein
MPVKETDIAPVVFSSHGAGRRLFHLDFTPAHALGLAFKQRFPNLFDLGLDRNSQVEREGSPFRKTGPKFCVGIAVFVVAGVVTRCCRGQLVDQGAAE